MNELREYPFDINIHNGLIFEDKQKLDNDEDEYLQSKDGTERFMFNMLMTCTILSNQGISFILPSTFGQGTFFGGIDGKLYPQFRKLDKIIHKPANEMVAFYTLALDLMKNSQERIEPFVILTHRGWCACAVPVRYDQTPYRDLGMRNFSSALSAMNCGNLWVNPQAQFLPCYDEFEQNLFRKYVHMEIEEELSESGTISVIPQRPIMRYHTPVFPLRFSRYFDSEILIGISPHPLQCENYLCKTLSPFQIRKVVTMMGFEGDVRHRWKLSERERVRKLLNISDTADEEKEQEQIILYNSAKTKEQKQNLIKLYREIRDKEQEDEFIS
ncbi:MAG: hypothetical protein EZS28_004956 [Streblomastix strix]|uniref:Uncharacterized protein n=1 Tax=Streblomastix strix TaxID=222440 RepID=A0A5J4WY58_9EUKA|nr:MAG: hypothetical protein EZS28_004956 [Streblomastix strix]